MDEVIDGVPDEVEITAAPRAMRRVNCVACGAKLEVDQTRWCDGCSPDEGLVEFERELMRRR